MVLEINELNPPVFERTASDVQMELIAVCNEINQLEARLDYLRDRELDLGVELQTLRRSITKRSQHDIDREREYVANFVLNETLGDIIDL